MNTEVLFLNIEDFNDIYKQSSWNRYSEFNIVEQDVSYMVWLSSYYKDTDRIFTNLGVFWDV